eukprot:Sspe_Gene.115181::Locus_102154_Transcript_1_1_Confidence_1.000_Length_1251::g.115181::m.115181
MHVKCPLCRETIVNGLHSCPEAQTAAASPSPVDSPPARAVEAATIRGDTVAIEVSAALVYCTKGRLEKTAHGEWQGCIFRIELTPKGSRALLSRAAGLPTWVPGILPQGAPEALVERIADLADQAEVPHNLRPGGDYPSPVQSPSNERDDPPPEEVPPTSPSSNRPLSSSTQSNRLRRSHIPPRLQGIITSFRSPFSSARNTPRQSPSSNISPTATEGITLRPSPSTLSSAKTQGCYVEYSEEVRYYLCKMRRLERFVNGEWQQALNSLEAPHVGSTTLLWKDVQGSRLMDTVPPEQLMPTLECLQRICIKGGVENDLRRRLNSTDEDDDAREPQAAPFEVDVALPNAAKGGFYPVNGNSPSPRSSTGQSPTCCVCLENDRNTVLFPCRHLCACSQCSLR